MSLIFLIQLLAGAVGGNVLGGLWGRFDLGPLRTTVAGLAGGLVGGQVLTLFEPAFDPRLEAAMNAPLLAAQILGCGLGGAAVVSLIGLVRRLVTADTPAKINADPRD